VTFRNLQKFIMEVYMKRSTLIIFCSAVVIGMILAAIGVRWEIPATVTIIVLVIQAVLVSAGVRTSGIVNKKGGK